MDFTCVHCGELIVDGDWDPSTPVVICGAPIVHQMHPECAIRTVIGPIGHLKRTCGCYGGSEGDPVSMTKREAARAAAHFWETGRDLS